MVYSGASKERERRVSYMTSKKRVDWCDKVGPNVIQMGASYYSKSYRVLEMTSQYRVDEFRELSVLNYDSLLDTFLEKWEIAAKENEEIHQKNLPKIQELTAEIEEIHSFMASKGFGPTYKAVDEKSRKNIKPLITHTSGYVLDMKREYSLEDGYAAFVSKHEAVKNKIKVLRELCARERREIDNKKGQEKKTNKNFARLIEINTKLPEPIQDIHEYDLEDMAWSVRERVLRQSKLLALADAMCRVRGNWNDGCGLVEDCLFVPSNQQETEIIAAVSDAVDSFHDCQDGRVFRDCDWSYTDIFGKVKSENEELYSLYSIVSEVCMELDV